MVVFTISRTSMTIPHGQGSWVGLPTPPAGEMERERPPTWCCWPRTNIFMSNSVYFTYYKGTSNGSIYKNPWLCVCVCTFCIEVKLHSVAGGHGVQSGTMSNEATWLYGKQGLISSVYLLWCETVDLLVLLMKLLLLTTILLATSISVDTEKLNTFNYVFRYAFIDAVKSVDVVVLHSNFISLGLLLSNFYLTGRSFHAWDIPFSFFIFQIFNCRLCATYTNWRTGRYLMVIVNYILLVLSSSLLTPLLSLHCFARTKSCQSYGSI